MSREPQPGEIVEVERASLKRFLMGGRLTPDEAAEVAAALIPGRMPPVDAPFETLEEGRLPDGTPYRIKAVGLSPDAAWPGGAVILSIEGHGGTSTGWLLKRGVVERLRLLITEAP
jgi:hypothetical protein